MKRDECAMQSQTLFVWIFHRTEKKIAWKHEKYTKQATICFSSSSSLYSVGRLLRYNLQLQLASILKMFTFTFSVSQRHDDKAFATRRSKFCSCILYTIVSLFVFSILHALIFLTFKCSDFDFWSANSKLTTATMRRRDVCKWNKKKNIAIVMLCLFSNSS